MDQGQATIEELIGYEELIRLAMAGLDVDEPLYQPVEEAVRQLLLDPACPVKPPSHAQMDTLDALFEELHEGGSNAFGEATTVSLNRIRLEIGWNPAACPAAAKLLNAGDGETLLEARHAFGIIALAWQVQSHPRDVIVTAGRFLKAIN